MSYLLKSLVVVASEKNNTFQNKYKIIEKIEKSIPFRSSRLHRLGDGDQEIKNEKVILGQLSFFCFK